MANKLNFEEIRAILESGNFDYFIGAIEDERFECKSEPYQLEHVHQKQELGKDVVSLANAEGGIILLGVKTEKDATQLGDIVKDVRPFENQLINKQQYHDVLDNWIYPNVHGIEIVWFPYVDNQERGLAAIFVPKQRYDIMPFLLTRTIDDKGKLVEVVFGYFERKRAGVSPITVQRLQSLLKDGLRFDLINDQLENIQETILSLMGPASQEKEIAAQAIKTQLLSERIEEALSEVGFQNNPAFILTATLMQAVEIQGLFERRNADVVVLLRDPPELRYSGFDLNTGASPHIVRGQLRRAVTREYKILDLWRDGTLVFAAPGDSNFLSWPKPLENGALYINPLVLAESTYLFANLSQLIYNHAQPNPNKFEFRLEIRNMTVNGNPCILIPGSLKSVDWIWKDRKRPAPNSDSVFLIHWEGDIKPSEIISVRLSQS